MPMLAPEDIRDELTARYFNTARISTRGYFLPIQLSGGVLDRDTSALLLGAPDGARIFVKKSNQGLELEATHSEFFNAPCLMLLAKDSVLHWEGLFLKPDAPEGLGTRIVATSLLTASHLGIRRVELMAWGPPAYNGHYTWARWGFDGVFDSQDQERLYQAGFPPLTSVSELMASESGRRWWKQFGWNKELTFDLDLQGKAMQTLQNYLADKGVKL